MAVRGTRNMDHGVEQIEDAETVRRLRWQTFIMYAKSLGAAAALTAVGYLFFHF